MCRQSKKGLRTTDLSKRVGFLIPSKRMFFLVLKEKEINKKEGLKSENIFDLID
jgi:hypothetical protein